VHLKLAINGKPQFVGKSPSKLQQNNPKAGKQLLQANTATSSSISTTPEDTSQANFEVSPYNTVNMEEFDQLMGGLHSNANPPNSILPNNLPFNLTTQNSTSTSVTIFKPNGNINQIQANMEEDNNGEPASNTVQNLGVESGISGLEQEDTVVSEVDQEVNQMLSQQLNTAEQTQEDSRDSDTPSPMQYCEGQVFVLNKAMQFVRFNATVGDKYVVTNKGLEKLQNDDSNLGQQTLTLKGKFSFSFDSN
jgi:hypothetical protein